MPRSRSLEPGLAGVAGEYFKAAYRGDRFKFALRAAEAETVTAGAAPPIDLVLT